MSQRLAAWRFPFILALLLSLVMLSSPPHFNGDTVEYTLDTIALANHGSADIRLSDIARGKELVPPLSIAYQMLEDDMQAGKEHVYAAFVRGREGKVYSNHFAGYSALAVPAFKLLDALHRSPFRSFQVVNLFAVFVLGLALRRFFGSELRALGGLGLFMLCAGVLYINWTSPECMSAALLLAGLLLFCSGAPVWGGLAAGIAALQNPTIVLFVVFAPLLLAARNYHDGASGAASVRAVLTRRNIAGLALGAAVFALPLLFNLYQWGVPNIIAKLYSDPGLVSGVRLFSFYFDLNQGVMLAIPGVAIMLLIWGWGRGKQARGHALLLGVCTLFALALTLPALAVLNWNSDAAGVMRYGLWGAAPFLFALLLRLAGHARWDPRIVVALALTQAAAMVHCDRYGYIEFSPLARLVLQRAPGLYYPEPEIFAERSGHNDDYVRPDQVYSYDINGLRAKTMLNVANPGAEEQLCGSGGALAPDTRFIESAHGWRYVDGPLRCASNGSPKRSFAADQFTGNAGLHLASGWSGVEHGGGGWNGAWSTGAHSRITLDTAGLQPQSLAVAGHYFDGNHRTRVTVNGVDLGWHQLDQEGPLALPPAARQAAALDVDLLHEAPRAPARDDPRQIAFFLNHVEVRDATVSAAARR